MESDPKKSHLSNAPSRELVQRFNQFWTGDGDPQTASPELLPGRLAKACAAVLPVDGAGLSLFDADFRVPLGASDEMSTLAERLQFTQGEGPCLDAGRNQRTLVLDTNDISGHWPAFAEQLFQNTPYRAIISLPLATTDRSTGALDLFLIEPERLGEVSLADAVTVTTQVSRALDLADHLRQPSDDLNEGVSPTWLQGPSAARRANVWIAMGMAMARFHLTATDALALLRSHAYGEGCDLDELAEAVMQGRVNLRDMLP